MPKEVPGDNHISRYCGFTKLKQNGWASAAAFLLREMEDGQAEDGLSVNWLEHLKKATRFEAIREIQDILDRKMPNGAGAKAKLAVLNVGTMRGHVLNETEDNRNLCVFHNRSRMDPSHSLIDGLRLDDLIIAELIAEVVQEMHPAKR